MLTKQSFDDIETKDIEASKITQRKKERSKAIQHVQQKLVFFLNK